MPFGICHKLLQKFTTFCLIHTNIIHVILMVVTVKKLTLRESYIIYGSANSQKIHFFYCNSSALCFFLLLCAYVSNNMRTYFSQYCVSRFVYTIASQRSPFLLFLLFIFLSFNLSLWKTIGITTSLYFRCRWELNQIENV